MPISTPTPQSPPVPQQLGEKAHLRIAWSVAAVLANATATTLVTSVQGPAPARLMQPDVSHIGLAVDTGDGGLCRCCSSSICFTGSVLTTCLPRVCFSGRTRLVLYIYCHNWMTEVLQRIGRQMLLSVCLLLHIIHAVHQ